MPTRPQARRRARLAALAAMLIAVPAISRAAALVDVLERPALQIVRPTQAVLLAAAQADGRLVVVGERGVIVSSGDGGRSWQQARVPVSVTLTAVCLLDARTGYAVGHGGVVLATDDGGRSWRKLIDGTGLAQVALSAARADGSAAALKDAERLVADGADKPLLDLHFFDTRRGIVVGAYNLAFSTEDGGRSWQSIAARFDNPRGLHLYAIRARGQTLVVVGEQGLVFLSDDAGRSFRRLATPYKGSFFTAELPADDKIVVAGLRGNAWQSNDRGASWSPVAIRSPATFTASALESGNAAGPTLVLGNQAGTLYTLNAGRWVARHDAVPAPLAALLPLGPLDGGRLLALGRTGIVLLPAAPAGANAAATAATAAGATSGAPR